VDIRTKKDLRERILTLLRQQKEEERVKKSFIISQKLFQLKSFQQAKTVLFYSAFDGEVHTIDMIKEAQQLGKKIGLPKVNKAHMNIIPILVNDLEGDTIHGPFGIREPKGTDKTLPLDQIDMVIVPGVAFDKSNHRLGRGAGFYDRFLKSLPPSVPTVGLAFDFQVIDHFPKETHDMPVSCVLTN
jgi:5-formyltetrahydrofolate cyclo-ligase